MNKEKDFLKTCFNTVAGLEVRNESQAIAKEVVLSEIENLQQENQELKKQLEDKENIACNWKDSCLENAGKIENLQNNWNELKKELKEKIDICDGCIDTMQSDLQEIAPRENGKSYLTSEIFKNKVAKISFEFTLKHMQELEQGKDD